MAIITHNDYDIAWNRWGDAIVYHIPTKITFIGCGNRDKAKNLYAAMDAMEKVVKVWKEK